MHVYVYKYMYKKIYVYMIYVEYICVYIYIYIIDTYYIYIYIYIYILYIHAFSSCLLQHCNIYYFVSQCMFSHAVHEQVFKTKFLTCFIDLFLLFNL